MRVLVTGANGFMGGPVCRRLAADGRTVAAAVRPHALVPARCEARPAPDLDGAADWSAALAGIDAVVHLAARVHVMHDDASDPLAAFRAVNTLGTLRLAEQAALAGIGHFIMMSSVKACGEETFGTPFGPTDSRPVDPYGISKLEAERGLARIAAGSGMAVTCLRPPLIHGPGVKGNLSRLLSLVDRKIPLPLGCVDNRRSLLGVDNLADALAAALDRPPPAGRCRVLTLCDAETVSTAGLVRLMGTALGRPARLVPVPVALIRLGGRLTGRDQAVRRLIGSLEVDGTAIARELGWTPRLSLADGMAATARWWRDHRPD